MSVESSNQNVKDTHLAHQRSGPRRTIIEISLSPNFQQSLVFCGVALYPVETISHYALKLWQPTLWLASIVFLKAGHSDVVCDCVNDEGDNCDGNPNDVHCVRHSERDVRRG
jgi:ubiquitin